MRWVGGLFSLGLAKKIGLARRAAAGILRKGAMPGTAAGAARNPWLVFLRERARSEAYRRADTSTAATPEGSAGSSGTSRKDVGSMAISLTDTKPSCGAGSPAGQQTQ